MQGEVQSAHERQGTTPEMPAAQELRSRFAKPTANTEAVLRLSLARLLEKAKTLYKSAPPSSSVTTLVAPTDGTQVTGNSVNLSWELVNEATNYGVEIVCTKGSTPYIYSVNVLGGVCNTKFDLSNVPNGSYQWSVIAFNGNGVMGKFSKSRTFVVAR